MSTRHVWAALAVVFALGSGLTTQHALAQSQHRDDVSVAVSMVATEGSFSDLDRRVVGVLREALRRRGIDDNEESALRFLMLADVLEIPESDRIVLSVTTLVGLPQEVIELAGREEAFYLTASMQGRAFPPEGKALREYVSKDWIRTFYSVEDQDLRILERSDLEAVCLEIVEAFWEKHAARP